MDSRHVKTVFKGDIRRFRLPDFSPYKELTRFLERTYPKQEGLKLCYKDDEGDLISISSSQELLEGCVLAEEGSNVLKLFVTSSQAQDPKVTPPYDQDAEASAPNDLAGQIEGFVIVPDEPPPSYTEPDDVEIYQDASDLGRRKEVVTNKSQHDNISIEGTYECVAYTKSTDHTANDWHYVTIKRINGGYTWSNKANVTWHLDELEPANEQQMKKQKHLVAKVHENCPYYKNDHHYCGVKVKNGKIEGLFGPWDEFYEWTSPKINSSIATEAEEKHEITVLPHEDSLLQRFTKKLSLSEKM